MSQKLSHVPYKASLPGVGRLGVPESWIVKYIQQREAFHKLPAEVITEGIEELTGESLIYPLTPNSYRSVT